MIVFDLECRAGGHRFEGWFGSSDDFARQQERGLVTCPTCGSADVVKAVMAPNVGRKGNQLPAAAPTRKEEPAPAAGPAPVAGGAIPAPVAEALRQIAALQAEALKSSKWVGGKFAEDARAMHYGEKDVEAIHGQATPAEARELMEEGIEVAPILFPLAPPGEAN
ncbi:MAG: DUF1178 family protein [Sphingomonadales bacterium]|nr:DUF1178 family protein [Sphingomonadales bacterium]MDE2568109.1 DUF1178 family protein [Sphingomonadales bacterium]